MGEIVAVVLLVVLYIRVSTEDQAKRGYSVPEQREACLQLARQLATTEGQRTGIPVQLETVEFLDTVSGELLGRPELDRLRDFVKERRPHYLICLDPDRFSRTTYHALMIVLEVESAGTKLEFIQHDYQATPEGKLFFTLRVAIAEFEKAKIQERTTRGKRGKMKEGKLPVGLHMYGYHYDKETQVISPDPDEVPWVQKIFMWATAERMGCQLISNRLNELGVRTKRGTRWYRGTVSKILRQRGYVGEMVVNRYNSVGLGVQRQLPRNRRTRTITPTQRPKEDWVIIPIFPLITRELWVEAQTVRGVAANRVTPQRTGLLSGLMTCGYCGGPVHYRPHKTRGNLVMCANRYPYMRDLKHPAPVCRSLSYQAVGLFEEFVWAQVKAWLTTPEHIRAHIESQRGPEAPSIIETLTQEASLLERQLSEKQKEQKRLLAVVATGAIDPEVAAQTLAPYGQQMSHLRDAIARLKDRIAQHQLETERRQSAVDRVQAIRDDIVGKTEDIRSRLAMLDGPQRQTLVRMLVRQVLIYRDGVCEIDAMP